MEYSAATVVTFALSIILPFGQCGFKEVMLSQQNIHRVNGALMILDWNDKLASEALENATNIASETKCRGEITDYSKRGASTCLYDRGEYGEDEEKIAQVCSEQLYSQLPFYKFPGGKQPFNLCNANEVLKTSHVVQMMWAKTTEVGCAPYNCPYNQKTIVSCFYSPRGLNVAEPMFSDDNFRRVCGAEPDKWTTCDQALKDRFPVSPYTLFSKFQI